ncbi:organic cation/carnitine transporter 2-like [Narcine bancroftii]|uniref:organic cation/carnitine transporter 2-like n=1 Tax=Narcine bancroftii TaxID=1343680 RepID=UPI003831E8E4
MQDYDEATAFLGSWGFYQKRIFIFLCIGTIPSGYMSLSMVFLADTPQHHCRLSNSSNDTFAEATFGNLSLLLPLAEDEKQVYSKCTRFKHQVQDSFNDSTREIEHCVDGWVYSRDRYISTIVSEWNLVCENNWKGPFTMSVFFVGMTFGAFISGHISDRYGRKSVLFGALLMQIVLSLIQVVSWSWEIFCILYFFIGIGDVSKYVSAFVLGTEILGKVERNAYSTLGICLFYAIGYTILPFFAYYIREWRMLLLALTLPEILYLSFWWLIPESPRWLINKGRVSEAEEIVQDFAKKNGITHVGVIFPITSSRDFTHLNISDDQKYLYGYMDLIKTPNIRNITILSFFVWMIVSIGYFVLNLGIPNMYGDLYLNCLIFAVSEAVAYIVAWWMTVHVPRRVSVSSSMLLAAALLLIVEFIPPSLHILTTALIMIGKTGIAITFAIIFIYSAELYPTVVRNMGIGTCCTASRIGSIFSPYFVYLATYNRMLPFILMGIFIFIAGCFCLLLPETCDCPLPERIYQMQPIKCLCSSATSRSGFNGSQASITQEIQAENNGVLFSPSQMDQNVGLY